MIRKFFTSAANPHKGRQPISKQKLNSIIPQAFQNFTHSCEAFFKGLEESDNDFLQSIMSPFLYLTLQPDIKKLKEGHLCIKIEKKMGEENLIKELAVYPYILFGGNFKSRLKNKEKYMKITSNRYVRMKTEEESLEKYVRTIIQNNPIYGFECFVKMKDEYQIEEESEGWKQAIHQDHYFLINFETDSSNEDYFITNIQDIAK